MKRLYSLTRIYICFLLSAVCALPLAAQASVQQRKDSVPTLEALFKQADAAYVKANYVDAAQIYEKAMQDAPTQLSLAESADAYYNLGNCYYRLKNYPRAVLAYKRALRYNPANEDAAFNLELTQAKLTDRFDAPSEMFFISMMRDWVRSQNHHVWGLYALGALLLCFVGIALSLFGRKIWLRKTALAFSVLCAVCTIAFHVFGSVQLTRFNDEVQVVVMKSSNTYATPTASGAKVRTLNEGTSLRVLETYGKNWIYIEMPDGRQAWMLADGTERI